MTFCRNDINPFFWQASKAKRRYDPVPFQCGKKRNNRGACWGRRESREIILKKVVILKEAVLCVLCDLRGKKRNNQGLSTEA